MYLSAQMWMKKIMDATGGCFRGSRGAAVAERDISQIQLIANYRLAHALWTHLPWLHNRLRFMLTEIRGLTKQTSIKSLLAISFLL
ncbi:hypothetical protein FGO68_gene15869 [Halteria grandinella]|uniref:Uncharacterized protein n=1 Tax=Halteria grandinella TaxID=5974 RepID=A0A8J8P6R4_HALGN|nr:hypothetical protein FGO68_gene15869 [Halteria grandinella]